jgi:hypothetical protein
VIFNIVLYVSNQNKKKTTLIAEKYSDTIQSVTKAIEQFNVCRNKLERLILTKYQSRSVFSSETLRASKNQVLLASLS